MNLKLQMAALKEPPNNSQPPLWDYWRHDLWTRAQHDEPRNFMRWPSIYHTMLQEHIPAIIKFEESRLPPELRSTLVAAAQADRDELTSYRNLVHQTYHLYQWQAATGKKIADVKIVCEFGGGYGGMCLAAHCMGFQGRWHIYDFPEFATLQRWYINEHGLENVHWIGSRGKIKALDLLIACYSLSETDFGERDNFLHTYPAASYLFLYSNKFEAFNNIDYFQSPEHRAQWVNEQNQDLVWWHQQIDHLPPESWYSFGTSGVKVIPVAVEI